MANLAILGHPTRGREVVELLEMLGGKNVHDYVCNIPGHAYIINKRGIIGLYISHPNSSFAEFTLEEFLEKFPYKVGDKVNSPCKGCVKTITSMEWDIYLNTVTYKLDNRIYTNIDQLKVVNDLQPYEEETMEKIDIAKLLKDCPQGMELNCTVYDECILDNILEGELYPIKIQTPEGKMLLTKYGSFSCNKHSKCIIFPKDKTTWEGFVPPSKFKDGDVLYIRTSNQWICIYKEGGEKENVCHRYVAATSLIFVHDDSPLCHLNNIKEIRRATEEEKEKLFKVIKDNGYNWNAETKKLEKLFPYNIGTKVWVKSDKERKYIHTIVGISYNSFGNLEYEIKEEKTGIVVHYPKELLIPITTKEPRFKVGDTIQSKEYVEKRTIQICEKDGYWTTVNSWIKIEDQDKWELVPNKFDINTLKPFAEVLVRNTNNERWRGQFYMSYDKNEEYLFECVYNCWKQCIPYENNEHLFNKIDDCTDYFKTWE